MKKIILVIVLISPLLATGQIKDSSNFFINAEIEYFIISQKNIGNTTYSYVNGVAYSIGLGYIVFDNLYIISKFSNVPLKHMNERIEWNLINGVGETVGKESIEYTIAIKQSLFKIGFQYSIISNNTIIIGLLGGINRIAVEERQYIKETNDLVSSGKGNTWGFFVGFALEKKIKTLPISIYSNAQYFGGDILGFLNVPDIGTRVGFQFGLGVKYSF